MNPPTETTDFVRLTCDHEIWFVLPAAFFNTRQIVRNRAAGVPTTIWCGVCQDFRDTRV